MSLIKQGICFLITSGTGFLIDFLCYYFLLEFIGIDVSYANMMSSIPAITFVFFVSTKKIFKRRESSVTLGKKYLIYFIYQMILVVSVSLIAGNIYNYLINILNDNIILGINIKIVAKLIITPFTMLCNFIFMKVLTERI